MSDDGGQLETALAALSLSSLNARTAALQTIHREISKKDVADKVEQSGILTRLLHTYAHYKDRNTRQGVRNCLELLIASSDVYYNALVQFLEKESHKSAIAPSNLFVLLEWAALAVGLCSQEQTRWSEQHERILFALARFLEHLSTENVRESVQKSAKVVTRRALRRCFRDPVLGKEVIRDAVTTLTKKNGLGYRSGPLLNAVFGVCARLDPAKAWKSSSPKEVAAEHVDAALEWITRELLGSKTAVPRHISFHLKDIISEFVDENTFKTTLVPALEKAMLRAPEIVLPDFAPHLLRDTNTSLDVGAVFVSSLSKPLLSNLKSAKPEIRQGSADTIEACWKGSHDKSRVVQLVVDASSGNKLTTPEQRLVHATLLGRLVDKKAPVPGVITALGPLIAKESNEGALIGEIHAFMSHLAILYASDEKIEAAVQSSSKTIADGLNDKRASIKKVWAEELVSLLTALVSSSVQSGRCKDLVDTVLPVLQKVHAEVVAAPASAIQSGNMAVSYSLLALLPIITKNEFLQLDAKLLATLKNTVTKVDGNSLNWLLDSKYYSRLSTEAETTLFMRAIFAVIDGNVKSNVLELESASWGAAIVYLASSPQVHRGTKAQLPSLLFETYSKSKTQISAILVDAMFAWLSQPVPVNVDLPDEHIKARKDAGVILDILCPEVKEPVTSDSDLNEQLISMLVITQPSLLPGKSWIDLCLRSKVDPGTLVEKNVRRCLKVSLDRLPAESVDPTSAKAISNAVYATLAELAFVAPKDFTPFLVKQIERDLSAVELQSLTVEDFSIARTPEGVAFIDVLSKKQDVVLEKNSKDYDTLKWEAELRAQLAAKKGTERKLTAQEQASVNEQLRKESAIRKKVLVIEKRLVHGLGIVKAMAAGTENNAPHWLPISVDLILDVIANKGGILVGSLAEETFIACSELVTPRLGVLRKFLGIATVRAISANRTNLPAQYVEEPLEALATRILYRLRLVSEQTPFDPLSLSYILPLLSAVLMRGGIGNLGEEEQAEQVALAVEIIGFNSDIFKARFLNRARTMSILIDAMPKYSQQYREIKDVLYAVVNAASGNIRSAETRVLLHGTLSKSSSVRIAVLSAILDLVDLTDHDFYEEIYLAAHDLGEEIKELGQQIWTENAMDSTPEDAEKLLHYLDYENRPIREAAALSIAACVRDDPRFGPIYEDLQEIYREKAKPVVPKKDKYGMAIKTDLRDPWESRSGVALTFKAFAGVWPDSWMIKHIRFLIDEGVLGDRNVTVRDEMIDAGIAVIDAHGQQHLEEIMRILETNLNQAKLDATESDYVSEAAVILYGAVARHLKNGDQRIVQVANRLISTLSTPSESVQYAVVKCLPPLVRASSSEFSKYMDAVFEDLFNSKSFAARRGAAYGLAGIVSGYGVGALREFRILTKIKGALENKKEVNQRQGALFAYELFSLILGRLFEPYVLQLLPQLIASFGDASADVRDACLDAAKTCFSNLSSYGVKVVLPTLLEGLDETAWRSKKGACDLLGAMAYLDPQQLALSLPDIIPPLTNVLNDSHKEVRAAANRSLQRFGEVISNPEIKGLVGTLLKALSDPTKYTDDALDSLIRVSFVHYLDAPSLALVTRILERGLADRSATKRKAAQIIGSLAHLSERRDLMSHLPILVAGLKVAVVDPVPTTRATSSKALGSLIEKLGEESLPNLIPELMSTLKSDTGAGDRLGSAQALSEVLAGLGTSRLEETLPTILTNVSSPKATVREGFMTLLIFLPACFGNNFASYLSRIIPPVLSGLADEVESIRETALRAGRLLVKNFATKSIDLLLPELDRGLADDNYRIRLSSIELVGDLLFNLTGISGKVEQDEEDLTNASEAGQSLLEVLGETRRNRILSSLYICRCDTSGLVRTAAINVWKALVASPRTLKDILPTLVQLIVRRLASSNPEQKVIAGNALGELIRKAGEGVLSTLLPTLEQDLQTSTDVDNRQGICIALREIITASSEEILEDYEKTLISVLKVALVDSDDDVRETAAEAFDSLQQIFGKKAVDQVLPYLLNLLRSEESAEQALAALLTLLTDVTRANIILPNLIPTLIKTPISAFSARAIASLAEVAGSAINRRVSTILNALLDNILLCKDEGLKQELEESFDAIMLSVDESDGLSQAISVLLTAMKHNDHHRRAAAASRLGAYFPKSQNVQSRYNQDLIRVLLISYGDRDESVVLNSMLALTALVGTMSKEEMESQVRPTRTFLQQAGVAGHALPGFSLPKGINSVLPIFLQGLMNGTAEQRTSAALALSDIVDRANAESLRPLVTNITGPLIRVVSERSPELKSAILFTLNNLLEKIPLYLKPFLPQLQRTFAKSLADTSSDVLRNRAAKALGTLLTLKPRVDPLIAELITGAKTGDSGVRSAMLKALYEVVTKAGENMSEASRNSLLGLIDSDSSEEIDVAALTNARLLGAMIKVLPAADSQSLMKQRALLNKITPTSILNLNAILVEAPEVLLSAFSAEVPHVICLGIGNKLDFIAENSILAAGKYLIYKKDDITFDQSKPIFEALSRLVGPGNPTDSRRLSLVVIRTMTRVQYSVVRPHMNLLVPPIFASVRDMVIPIKLGAEGAFLGIFQVVEHEGAAFEKYIADEDNGLNPTVKRSMSEYFKRVALRLATQARERAEAEGGQGGLGLGSDEREDEAEIMSIGRIEHGEASFDE